MPSRSWSARATPRSESKLTLWSYRSLSLVQVLAVAAESLRSGDTVAVLREDIEVSPAEAAKLLGVSRQYVDRLNPPWLLISLTRAPGAHVPNPAVGQVQSLISRYERREIELTIALIGTGPWRSSSTSRSKIRTRVDGWSWARTLSSRTTATGSSGHDKSLDNVSGSPRPWWWTPERFRLVAVTGSPSAVTTWSVAAASGIRIPTVPSRTTCRLSSPSVGTTTETGPGSQDAIARQAQMLGLATAEIMAGDEQAMCMAFSAVRPLAVRTFAVATSERARAASMYPVSVGNTARPSRRRMATISSTWPSARQPPSRRGANSMNLAICHSPASQARELGSQRLLQFGPQTLIGRHEVIQHGSKDK